MSRSSDEFWMEVLQDLDKKPKVKKKAKNKVSTKKKSTSILPSDDITADIQEAYKEQDSEEKDVFDGSSSLEAREKRLERWEDDLARREESLGWRERNLNSREASLSSRERDVSTRERELVVARENKERAEERSYSRPISFGSSGRILSI